MQTSSSMQHYLPPIASVFSFPRQKFEFPERVDVIVSAAEYAVSVIFKLIRETLADGEGERNPVAMQTLSGLIGTGITTLESLLAAAEKIDSAKQMKLRALIEEYKRLFEDIELFSEDISAEDCFYAACTGKSFTDSNTPEEDEAWRDL